MHESNFNMNTTTCADSFYYSNFFAGWLAGFRLSNSFKWYVIDLYALLTQALDHTLFDHEKNNIMYAWAVNVKS